VKIEIKNRWTEKVIVDGEAESLRVFVEQKVKEKINLMGANLMGANLWGADLGGANLGGANLWGADLGVKVPPINSHDFVAEILCRAAKEEKQKDFCGRLLLQRSECWKYFIKLAKKKGVLKWAQKVLFKWDEFKQKFEAEK
jgi:hypothetical protein